MNHIEGFQTKISPKRDVPVRYNNSHINSEINFLMDCPEAYYAKRNKVKPLKNK